VDASRSLLRRCDVVWLEVTPAEAARRLGDDAATRPLLAGDDVATRLRGLLERRAEHYAALAVLRESTDGRTPDEIADTLARRLSVARQAAAVTRGSVRTWAAVLACASALLAGCAPHVAAPPELERDAVRAASRIACASAASRPRTPRARSTSGSIATAVVIRRGASARLWLEAPESFRIRAEGLVGTALDAAARGDSLVVQIPALDVRAITHDAAAAGGLGTAGSIVWNVLAAGFEPPDSAWLAATRRDSVAVVAWREGRDSLSLAIGASGLPSEARLRTHSGTEVVTRYERWQAFDRIPWPARLVIERRG
jgi:hypothetical protein